MLKNKLLAFYKRRFLILWAYYSGLSYIITCGEVHDHQICWYLRVFHERKSIFVLMANSSHMGYKTTENTNFTTFRPSPPPQGGKIGQKPWKTHILDIKNFLQTKRSTPSHFFIAFSDTEIWNLKPDQKKSLETSLEQYNFWHPPRIFFRYFWIFKIRGW